MCGIVGIYNFDRTRSVNESGLQRMRDRLRHRGPDAADSWINANVGLAHRRLAIIDTAHGQQPMRLDASLNLMQCAASNTVQSGDQAAVVLSYNGEIYNYVELREQLRVRGHSFQTESDTEVLLKAYAEWGRDCVQHFNGVWAFALYDARNDSFFCSRDRLGEKPLYYAVYDNTLLVASEIKALVAYGVPKEWNPELLDIYLSLNYIPAPYTFYRHISKLEAGCHLLVNNNTLHIERYWQLPMIDEQERRSDEKLILSEVGELLHDAVRLRMRSDVAVGAFLSGGLDSSSVVRIASRLSDKPLLTFTAGFANPDVDERNLAWQVARHCGTVHHSFEIDLHNADTLIPDLLDVYDEPFGDSSALATYIIAREAAQHVSVILTGDGGDEAMVGYTIHQGEKLNGIVAQLPMMIRARFAPKLVHALQGMLNSSYSHSLKRLEDVLRASGMSFPDRLISKQIGFRSADRSALLREHKAMPIEDFIADRLSAVAHSSTLNQLHYWLTSVSLPDDMLTKVDRATMAHGLEARLPFLDHRLVELLWQVKLDLRLKGFERKYLLRRLMRDDLPVDLFRVPKKGFVVPLGDWLADSASTLRQGVERAPDAGLVSRDALANILARHDNGDRSASNALWGVGMLSDAISRPDTTPLSPHSTQTTHSTNTNHSTHTTHSTDLTLSPNSTLVNTTSKSIKEILS